MAMPVQWVDAFTDRPFGGNPAAVCLTPAPVADQAMQDLAAEFGISETAFLVPGDGAGAWSLRWFTPTTEVDLCGHATLAAAHALLRWGELAPGATARFATRSGELTATVDGDLIELDFPVAPRQAVPVPGALAGPAVVGAERGGFLLLELADEAAVLAYRPDLAAIASVPDHGVIVTAAGDEPDVDFVLRMFAPKMGIDEDPVTGSAQCTAAPFWGERLGRRELVSCQRSARGGRLRARLAGDRVRIAGRATTVVSGTVEVP